MSPASITIYSTTRADQCGTCGHPYPECDGRRCDVCRKPICDRRPDAQCCGGPCRRERSRRRQARGATKTAASTRARRRKQPDLRVSYRKAVPHLAGQLNLAPETIAALLEPLLTPAARKHLRKGAR